MSEPVAIAHDAILFNFASTNPSFNLIRVPEIIPKVSLVPGFLILRANFFIKFVVTRGNSGIHMKHASRNYSKSFLDHGVIHKHLQSRYSNVIRIEHQVFRWSSYGTADWLKAVLFGCHWLPIVYSISREWGYNYRRLPGQSIETLRRWHSAKSVRRDIWPSPYCRFAISLWFKNHCLTGSS